MPVILYEMSHSPFCIPISRMLEAAGVPFQRVAVPNWDRSAVIQATGGQYYQVPVLEHDGRVIFEIRPDSQEVARYVDAEFCGARLFPSDQEGLQQILIEHLENDLESLTFRLADIHYIPAIPDLVGRVMTIRHKERKFGPGCVEAWKRDAAQLRAGVERLCARFDNMLSTRAFLLGAEPLYVDFLLHGILGGYTYQGWNELPAEQPHLTTWMARMREFRLPA